MPGLSLDNVSVRIGGATILDQVSVSVPAGALTAIIGPNGAGKSTLLTVAAGGRRPSAGTVRLGTVDIARLGVRELARRRAVMPQATLVAFPFTVREVVAMGRVAHGPSAAGQDEIVDEAMNLAGVAIFADRPIGTLSGGEGQRVAFARAIAQAAPVGPNSVILLDEPTAAMDVAHAEATLALTRDLAARGAAVGVALHDLDAAAAYADRLVLLDRGTIRRIGTVTDVCDAQMLSDVYATPIEVYDHDNRLRVAPVRTTSARPSRL